MEKKNPIEEARRYYDNAKTAIAKDELDTETGIYADRKYVKTAGNTLWNGCLVALDAVLPVREGLKKGQRPDIDQYMEAAGKRDKKLLAYIMGGYSTMLLSMGYDGCQFKKVCDAGFEAAAAIIDRCELLYNASKKNT